MGPIIFKNESGESDEEGLISLESTFFPAENPSSTVATIALRLSDLNVDQDEQSIDYSVQFKSRYLSWKYYIINNDVQNPNNDLKLGGEGAELFNDPIPAALPNNSNALLFDSGTNLIPLKEKSLIDLSLIRNLGNKNNSRDEILIEHLPNANPDSFQAAMVDGKREIYSPIYVYV